MTVWRFQVPLKDEFIVTMPSLAKVLHVAVQHGEPQLWVLVNVDNLPLERTFYVRGTGHAIDRAWVHLGTFLLDDGSFVGHLFEHAAARLMG